MVIPLYTYKKPWSNILYIKNIFSHRTIISVIMLFFILGFSLISLNTGINFIQNKDSSESYESLVNIALNKKNNVDIQREISEAEDNIANGLYFKMLRSQFNSCL